MQPPSTAIRGTNLCHGSLLHQERHHLLLDQLYFLWSFLKFHLRSLILLYLLEVSIHYRLLPSLVGLLKLCWHHYYYFCFEILILGIFLFFLQNSLFVKLFGDNLTPRTRGSTKIYHTRSIFKNAEYFVNLEQFVSTSRTKTVFFCLSVVNVLVDFYYIFLYIYLIEIVLFGTFFE